MCQAGGRSASRAPLPPYLGRVDGHIHSAVALEAGQHMVRLPKQPNTTLVEAIPTGGPRFDFGSTPRVTSYLRAGRGGLTDRDSSVARRARLLLRVAFLFRTNAYECTALLAESSASIDWMCHKLGCSPASTVFCGGT